MADKALHLRLTSTGALRFGFFLDDLDTADAVFSSGATSLTFAGLLVNGIVLSRPTTKEDEEGAEEASQSSINTTNTPETLSLKPQLNSQEVITTGEIPVLLPSGIKITFPVKYSFEVATGKFSEAIKRLNEDALSEVTLNEKVAK